jgi:ABC-type multidrug transport system, ATPase component
MIEIKHLTKKFGDVSVIEDLSMVFEEGKIYGLVGRNGSGKTMLMKHILGFVHATSGSIIVDGKEIGKDIDLPQNIGAIIENPGFLPEYSGMKNLRLLSVIQGKIGKAEVQEAMHMVGLDPASKKHVGKYSLGMKQRLGIAQALMEDPDILLLDEPMNGLDNEGVREIREILLQQKKNGKILVIASHNKEDIDVLCDEIFYLDKGKVIQHSVKESVNADE